MRLPLPGVVGCDPGAEAYHATRFCRPPILPPSDPMPAVNLPSERSTNLHATCRRRAFGNSTASRHAASMYGTVCPFRARAPGASGDPCTGAPTTLRKARIVNTQEAMRSIRTPLSLRDHIVRGSLIHGNRKPDRAHYSYTGTTHASPTSSLPRKPAQRSHAIARAANPNSLPDALRAQWTSRRPSRAPQPARRQSSKNCQLRPATRHLSCNAPAHIPTPHRHVRRPPPPRPPTLLPPLPPPISCPCSPLRAPSCPYPCPQCGVPCPQLPHQQQGASPPSISCCLRVPLCAPNLATRIPHAPSSSTSSSRVRYRRPSAAAFAFPCALRTLPLAFPMLPAAPPAAAAGCEGSTFSLSLHHALTSRSAVLQGRAASCLCPPFTTRPPVPGPCRGDTPLPPAAELGFAAGAAAAAVGVVVAAFAVGNSGMRGRKPPLPPSSCSTSSSASARPGS